MDDKQKILDTPASWVQTTDISSDGERVVMRTAKDILAMESLKAGYSCSSRELAMENVFGTGGKARHYPE